MARPPRPRLSLFRRSTHSAAPTPAASRCGFRNPFPEFWNPLRRTDKSFQPQPPKSVAIRFQPKPCARRAVILLASRTALGHPSRSLWRCASMWRVKNVCQHGPLSPLDLAAIFFLCCASQTDVFGRFPAVPNTHHADLERVRSTVIPTTEPVSRNNVC
jgi:hypothetical protein